MSLSKFRAARVPILLAALTVAVAGCSDSGNETAGIVTAPVTSETLQPGVSVPVASQPTVDQTTTETPVVDDPVVETPIVEAPGGEDTVDELPLEDTDAGDSITDTESPVAPTAEVPVQDDPVTQDPAVDDAVEAGNGSILGRITQFTGDSALSGVAVALSKGTDDPQATTTSDANGDFRFDNLAPSTEYRVDFQFDGFKTESFNAINLLADESEQLQPIRLISNDNAGNGGLSGTIVNAVDGSAVDAATLNFRPGINNRTSIVIATATTDAQGDYTVNGIPFGNVTLETIKQGLETSYTTLYVLGNIVRAEQNLAISPQVVLGETRVVLTWGEVPRDLDAHLTGPSADGGEPFRVFYARRSVDGVVLDVDDTSSFGPETITFDAARTGTFRYSVNRFSSGTPSTLAESGARVQVLQEDGVIADFFVPSQNGDIWTVFDMVDGQVLPVNTIIPRTGDDADYFAPDTLADL